MSEKMDKEELERAALEAFEKKQQARMPLVSRPERGVWLEQALELGKLILAQVKNLLEADVVEFNAARRRAFSEWLLANEGKDPAGFVFGLSLKVETWVDGTDLKVQTRDGWGVKHKRETAPATVQQGPELFEHRPGEERGAATQ